MKTRIATLAGLAAFLAAILALLVSGKRILFHEKRVDPGERYIVAEHGDLGAAANSSLVCRYFTGRSIVTTVFWYSSNNIMGKDQCPFLTEQ